MLLLLDSIVTYLPIIVPIFVIETGMKIYTIIDVHKAERKTAVIGKTGWTIVIALITLAWLPYLLVGRQA